MADSVDGLFRAGNVIEMARRHPSFSLAMELLVSVPVAPAFVRFRDLQVDLFVGGNRSGNVTGLLKELSRRGYTVHAHNPEDGQGRQLSLPRYSHPEISAARRYWADVYGKATAVRRYWQDVYGSTRNEKDSVGGAVA